MNILAIETSCDETAAAVVRDGREILSSVVYSQVAEHQKYGGVVPEIASRRHTEQIAGVSRRALAGLPQAGGPRPAAGLLRDIDAVAVTYAPGLIGALLVGVGFAKGLALAAGKPLVPVHHIRGHVASCYLAHPGLEPPFLCLVASGGHTAILDVAGYTAYRIVGRTRDDAAGEAFDKAARVMGLGYPGGAALDALAQTAQPGKYPLPAPRIENAPYDFSFSGLKTSVVNLCHNAAQKGAALDLPALAADIAHTVAEILSSRFLAAARELGREALVCAGGVSANSRLRARLTELAAREKKSLFLPPLSLCGDNAAMIASQAYYEWQAGNRADMSLNGYATMEIA